MVSMYNCIVVLLKTLFLLDIEMQSVHCTRYHNESYGIIFSFIVSGTIVFKRVLILYLSLKSMFFLEDTTAL